MKKLAAVALAGAFSAGVAVAGLGQRNGLERPLVLRGAAEVSPLGLLYGGSQAWLVRLDRKTLRIRPGRRLGLAEYSGGGWSYSPDGRLLAFGNHSSTAITYAPARVRLVNARTLRKVRDVPLGITGEVIYAHWAAPDRLLALVQSREDSGHEDEAPLVTERVLVLDPATAAVRASEKLEGGHVAALATADDALALILEGSSYRPVRLVVAHGDGRLASVVLDRIQAGLQETLDEVPREEGVAVTVDRQGGRAYVVAAGDPVAQVDLATLRVDYHTLSQPVSLLGRLHDWLEPSAQAKGPLEGSWRYATWLGDGRLAVYGRDTSTYSSDDGLAVRERPSGLVVIDTQSWTSQVIDPRSLSLVVANDALLSWGLGWNSGTDRWTGAGLNVYNATGVRRSHLFGARMVYDVQVVGPRAFVTTAKLYRRYAIISLRTGRRLRTVRGEEMPLVLSSAGPAFYG